MYVEIALIVAGLASIHTRQTEAQLPECPHFCCFRYFCRSFQKIRDSGSRVTMKGEKKTIEKCKHKNKLDVTRSAKRRRREIESFKNEHRKIYLGEKPMGNTRTLQFAFILKKEAARFVWDEHRNRWRVLRFVCFETCARLHYHHFYSLPSKCHTKWNIRLAIASNNLMREGHKKNYTFWNNLDLSILLSFIFLYTVTVTEIHKEIVLRIESYEIIII